MRLLHQTPTFCFFFPGTPVKQAFLTFRQIPDFVPINDNCPYHYRIKKYTKVYSKKSFLIGGENNGLVLWRLRLRRLWLRRQHFRINRCIVHSSYYCWCILLLINVFRTGKRLRFGAFSYSNQRRLTHVRLNFKKRKIKKSQIALTEKNISISPTFAVYPDGHVCHPT